MRFRGIAKTALVLAALGSSPAFAREIVDATGHRTTLVDSPRRVVTLAPSLGELAADLVGTDLSRIVGVTEYTDYPPGLTRTASVGPYHQVNLEKVVSLRPDLVLATLDGNSRDQVLHLRELKVPVVVVRTEDFAQVGESVLLAARALGAEEQGKLLADRLRTGLDRIRKRAGEQAKVRVMLQVGDQPLVTVGRKSFLHEALESVGGVNIYADAKDHYPRPSMEDVVKRDPDVIVVLALGKDLAPYRAMAAAWARFPGLKAVREKRIRILQGDPILRPTLRLLEGLSLLEKAVHDAR
jgi:iron complex transport system substrate-binding protein